MNVDEEVEDIILGKEELVRTQQKKIIYVKFL